MKLIHTIAASLALAATVYAPAQTGPVFADNAKPRKALVNILAVSSATHNGYSGSQDVYLADIQLKSGEHQFVKLVDIYEGYGYGIRRSVLSARTPLKMQLVRQTGCDLQGSQIYLPADANIYDASVPDTLRGKANDVIPCYRTVHKTVKMTKK